MTRLAVDFGTSNTAAAVMVGGQAWKIPLEPGEDTLPTAMFFDSHDGAVLFGRRAVAALIEGREGRFLRALKSVLGTPLLREKRMLGGQRTTLLEVVAQFLTHVKQQAETQCHQAFDDVLSGRPVTFRSRNADEDAQAERDLTEAYQMAGFKSVTFLPEPEAAARACGGTAPGLGLVVDIGGGTSDFTVFESNATGIGILCSLGQKLGGTDFDRALNIDRAMPLFGLGSQLRREFGPGTTEAPRALFHDLATWERIPFQYTPDTLRAVQRMRRQAAQPELWARLETILDMEMAHDVAHAVENTKIAVNGNTQAPQGINLSMIEPGLSAPLNAIDLARVLTPPAQQIAQTAQQALQQAQLTSADLSRVVLVGGSSLLTPVETELKTCLPGVPFDRSDAFTAIVDGLAMAAV